MYCKNCGHILDDNADVCLNCGVYTDKGRMINQENAAKAQTNLEDAPSNGLDILSFLIPIIGVILGIVYLSTGRPRSGKRYLLIGLITWGVAFVILTIASNY